MDNAAPDASLAELLRKGFRYALALTHNKTQAEDLLQDAWLAILQANGPRQLPYLYTAIRSRYINQNKREQLVPCVSLNEYDIESLAAHQDDFSLWADQQSLQHSLHQLRPIERDVIYLAHYEGYTAQEIAQLTHQPRGTVLSLIHRARKKLQQFIESQMSEVKP